MKWKAKKQVNEEDWHIIFAYLPVKTQEGNYVWWENVYHRVLVGAFDIYYEYKELEV